MAVPLGLPMCSITGFSVTRHADGVNDGECWEGKAKLIGSGVNADDRFGFAVDVDNETIVVGAYQDEPTGGSFIPLNTGAAYIYRCVEYLFDGSGYCSGWDEEKQLVPANAGQL